MSALQPILPLTAMDENTAAHQIRGQKRTKRHACKRIIKFYRLEAQYAKDCVILVVTNSITDLFTNFGIVIYPFLGILEVVRNGEYLYFFVSYLATYLLELVCVGFLYYIFLFPFTLAAYAILGPIGFPLAIIHGIQFSNLVACHELRRDKKWSGLSLLRLTFTRHKMSSVLLTPDTMHLRPEDRSVPWTYYSKNLEFWFGAVPTIIIQFLITVIIFCFWYVISLIPIIGVLLLKFYTSPQRGFDYVVPFYRDIRQYDRHGLTRIYYGGYARWSLLGVSTGILESIPILAGMTVCTNQIGCTLWEISMVRKRLARNEQF